MPRTRLTLLILGALALAFLAFGAFVVVDVTRAPAATGERVRVTVSRGQAFGGVVDGLVARGLVRRGWTLRFFAQTLHHDRRIHRGTYEFAVGTPPVQILRAMVRGEILAVRVTVPEGFTTWQIAGAFEAAGVDSVELLGATRDAELRHLWRIPSESLEGYLFPDTYKVPFGSRARDVVTQLLERFAIRWTPELERRAAAMGLTRHEALTLASVIEAEAQVPDERPVVSAVYHNRLRRGMRLEADPTVAYAMGGYRGRLFYKDLDVDSPYNTYRHGGLPPGPICSAGLSAIRAALYPDSTVTALYFVARGDGRHVFSTTLAEHNTAVRRSRRERAQSPAPNPR
jgi:UPF0755 protein